MAVSAGRLFVGGASGGARQVPRFVGGSSGARAVRPGPQASATGRAVASSPASARSTGAARPRPPRVARQNRRRGKRGMPPVENPRSGYIDLTGGSSGASVVPRATSSPAPRNVLPVPRSSSAPVPRSTGPGTSMVPYKPAKTRKSTPTPTSSSGGIRWGRAAMLGGAAFAGGVYASNTGKGSTPGNQNLYKQPPPGMGGRY